MPTAALSKLTGSATDQDHQLLWSHSPCANRKVNDYSRSSYSWSWTPPGFSCGVETLHFLSEL